MDSEGDIAHWSQQEAEDIYDTIEWLSTQPWCNGSVGMLGNSWSVALDLRETDRLQARHRSAQPHVALPSSGAVALIEPR